MDTKLSYDDVLIEPRYSTVASRSDVSLDTEVTDILGIDVPVLSAPMDTVTEVEMAQAMADAGGMGFIHRYCSYGEQASMISQVDGSVGATVGLIDSNVEAVVSMLEDAGATAICFDIAHAHSKHAVEMVEALGSYANVPIVAGNVATPSGVQALYRAGADIVKVGIGPGSHCTTREVTGVGVPQFSAVNECSKVYNNQMKKIPIIADGGITKSGDAAKALLTGAGAVMIGGMFGACVEAPTESIVEDGTTYNITRGMASAEARNDSTEVENSQAVEGVVRQVKVTGTAADVVDSMEKGIRSAVSYCGSETLRDSRNTVTFIKTTPSTQMRNGSHGLE